MSLEASLSRLDIPAVTAGAENQKLVQRRAGHVNTSSWRRDRVYFHPGSNDLPNPDPGHRRASERAMTKRKPWRQMTVDDVYGEMSMKPQSAKDEVRSRFRAGLFDATIQSAYTQEYALSTPYKHGVIHHLMNDKLLLSVRNEICKNVQFTLKETDIYKIYQSGDLTNLDGLDGKSLAKLPSLLALRDALYSESFRKCISAITGCGPLSGSKMDMAINVYTPGCYLLCHDDVIGTRCVSYILYLTDPSTPWSPEWGGALRLFPVEKIKGKDGAVAKTPLPDASKVIPPAWNQLSFFAVQPGRSFHDVEEVYHPNTDAERNSDGGRVRMAISGWFHIPQYGEDGFIRGHHERVAARSSLMQLRVDPAQYDMPQIRPVKVDSHKRIIDESEFGEADLEFLLKYINPTYLTPDTIEEVVEHFAEHSYVVLDRILCPKFAHRLMDYVTAQERQYLPSDSAAIESNSPWKVARPPHKHRYLYQQATSCEQPHHIQEESPIAELLNRLLPSHQFRQWLRLATSLTVESSHAIARRFRRGQDYTLATGYDGQPRLEINLGFTPTPGWGDEQNDEHETEVDVDESIHQAKVKAQDRAKPKKTETLQEERLDDVGGQEVYMAKDNDGVDDSDDDDDDAIYKSSGGDEDILFHHAAAWNKLTIVLRDQGALNFVKYVNKKARGDRWDIYGVFGVNYPYLDDVEAGSKNSHRPLSPVEIEFNGFSDTDDQVGH